MGLIAQLILGGVVLAALGGAWWSHNNAQQEIGKAEIRAELEKQQKETEAANAMRALEGEKYALELLAKAERRNKQLAAQAAITQRQRQEESDARAKDDLEYSLWRERALPAFVVGQLRAVTELPATAAGDRRVPGGSGLSPGTAIPAAPATDESWLDRLRARIGGSTQGGLGSGGSGR